MAEANSVTIDQLSEASSLNSTDVFPVSQTTSSGIVDRKVTLTKLVEEIDSIVTTSGTITIKDTTVTTLNDRSYLIKIGKFVFMNFTFSTSASTSTILATIPEDFYPIHRMNFGVFNESSNSTSHTQTLPLQIRVDGTIRTLQIAPTSGDTYSGFAVWATA